MLQYKIDFIEFLLQAKALQFGEFTLKSGRISPYFFNSSLFNTGVLIERLGYFYASAVAQAETFPSLLFGPAYKGIPLCVATAMALATHFQKDVGYFFNRKEMKTHGDKGMIVGKMPQPEDHILMIDDVITEGTTKKESLKMVQQLTSAPVTAVLIAVDRMESNAEGKDTVQEFQQETGIPVIAIVTIEEICQYLLDREIEGKVYLTRELFHRIEAYWQQFRVRYS